jgi:hypothetical protein
MCKRFFQKKEFFRFREIGVGNIYNMYLRESCIANEGIKKNFLTRYSEKLYISEFLKNYNYGKY